MMKSRQMGASTTKYNYMLWNKFYDDVNEAIASHSKEKIDIWLDLESKLQNI